MNTDPSTSAIAIDDRPTSEPAPPAKKRKAEKPPLSATQAGKAKRRPKEQR